MPVSTNLQPQRTLAAMSTNATGNKHLKKIRASKDQLFAYYDAQPAATRLLLQNFPENIWPGSYADHTGVMAEARVRYLANLRNVWGPDHPAVIDAARNVAIRGRKLVKLATPDDLDF